MLHVVRDRLDNVAQYHVYLYIYIYIYRDVTTSCNITYVLQYSWLA